MKKAIQKYITGICFSFLVGNLWAQVPDYARTDSTERDRTAVKQQKNIRDTTFNTNDSTRKDSKKPKRENNTMYLVPESKREKSQ